MDMNSEFYTLPSFIEKSDLEHFSPFLFHNHSYTLTPFTWKRDK